MLYNCALVMYQIVKSQKCFLRRIFLCHLALPINELLRLPKKTCNVGIMTIKAYQVLDNI